MILFLAGFTDGLIFSKIAMSTGLYFLIDLRTRKINMAIAAENNKSESNTSAIINKAISQKLMDSAGIKSKCKVDAMSHSPLRASSVILISYSVAKKDKKYSFISAV